MALRALTAALLAALLLGACGGTPAAQSATTTGSSPATTQPTAIPAPTTFNPTKAPAQTIVVPPTTAPTTAPSAIAESTVAPTQAPAPAAEPTAAPAATPEATQAPAPTSAAATIAPATGLGSELVFLRQGTLVAFDIAAHTERTIATTVLDFAADPTGRSIALVRIQDGFDMWVVQRDGGGLRRITNDHGTRVEGTLAWSPDGAALAYSSADSTDPYGRTWLEWSAWCLVSEVHVVDVSSGADQNFGAGCDPAFSPDGKRIAYATPPSTRQEGANAPNATNTIRLINRQGQNGWSFATAAGTPDAAPAKRGLLVHAPAFAPDGAQLSYQRFLGYQALVDMAMTEIGGSFTGKAQPLNVGAGWLEPARFAPDGQLVAVVENNDGDARGFGGYDNWSVRVLRLNGSREIALPEGPIQATGQVAGELPRAQAAAWSPDGAALAVLLPPGWRPGLSPNQPVNADGKPGEIWRWTPGDQPAEKLAQNVDFASPVLWLPAAS